MLKLKLNAFSRTQNSLRSQEKEIKSVISFPKEEQTIVSFWRFFHETVKEKLENISLMFASCNPFPSLRSAAKHTVNYNLRELQE